MIFSSNGEIFGMVAKKEETASLVVTNEESKIEDIEESTTISVEKALEAMPSFTVGDEPQWIAAKYCAQICEGVNAFVMDLGRCEANFAKVYREELLSNPEFFNEAEKTDDNASNNSPEKYDVKKDRINKLKRKAKAVIQKIIAKIKDATTKILGKLAGLATKKLFKELSRGFMANVRKSCSKDEIEKAAMQGLPGQRMSVNDSLFKAGALINSDEILRVFQDYLDAKGDAADYKAAAADADNSKAANKYGAAADKASKHANDIVDKFDRKLVAKLVMVIPQPSSNENLTVNMLNDDTYNLEKCIEVCNNYTLMKNKFEKAQANLDTKFTNMILAKEVELEKHGNENEISAFVYRAQNVATRYVSLFGDCVNSVYTYASQCTTIFVKFCADLQVDTTTGLKVERRGLK